MGGLWTRRRVLGMLAAGTGAAVMPPVLRGFDPARASHDDKATGVAWDPAPFTLGVASGYPTTDSVILWTRLAPEPQHGDGGMAGVAVPVDWVVSRTPDLQDVVAQGVVQAVPEWGHSVHVEVTGLEPGLTYYYGFRSDGASSRIGRTKTAPAGPTDQLRFVVASCQRFEEGYYAAHRHIAEEDVDFVVHLGDYIYEKDVGGIRRHHGGTATTLEDYRIRHAIYKGDPDLRAAHAAHPWLLTWDDHEVFNNYQGTNPAFHHLMGPAYHAYYEHLPIRLTEDGLPNGRHFRIYQRATFGDLLDVAMLDTRQYRDELSTVENYPDNHQYKPDRTMLGADQKAWLEDLLSSSTTAWRLLANSLHLIGWAFPNNDSWDGYAYERRDLLHHIAANGIPDVVSVTGDLHRNMFNHVKLDKESPAAPVVLPEFGVTSISSADDGTNSEDRDAVYASSPYQRYFDADTNGYLVCDVTTTRWRATAWAITSRTNPNATKFLRTAFEVDRGDPVMRHVGGEAGNPLPDPLPASTPPFPLPA